ncbi:MAG: type II toxin-antitoxin system RelE/ParE family toxin [Bacillota bacterium]|nr:type II toxin-antitoxin system RelE/ParE family toxin [Bacillota bacterium]
MKLRYTDRAKEDIEFAFEWFEKQKKGLGFDFLDCIEIPINSICTFPEMCQKYYSSFRGCVIMRFPFSIFYTIEGEEIVIHSVFNNRQDPQKRP